MTDKDMKRFIQELENTKGKPTAFYSAMTFGLIDTIREYLDDGYDVNTRSPPTGWTPLMVAAYVGNHKLVKLLLDYGAKVNDIDDDRVSPIICASHNDLPEVDVYKTVKLLLEAGADKSQKDVDGKMAYDWASDGRYSAKIYDLLKNDEPETEET